MGIFSAPNKNFKKYLVVYLSSSVLVTDICYATSLVAFFFSRTTNKCHSAFVDACLECMYQFVVVFSKKDFMLGSYNRLLVSVPFFICL